MGANPQNLRVPTSEEARRNGRKGGLASGVSRAKKKTTKECLLALRDLPMTKERCKEMGLEPGSTYGMGWAMALANGTLDGNPALAKLALELAGEHQQEININGGLPVVIHDDIR